MSARFCWTLSGKDFTMSATFSVSCTSENMGDKSLNGCDMFLGVKGAGPRNVTKHLSKR